MKLIILERDGVINEDRGDITAPEQWQPIAGSLEAIARLNHAGYRVVVATNQSGLGRGLFDMATLLQVHDKLHRALAMVGGSVEAVFFCPHLAEDHCGCRKPKPGMLLDIAARLQTELNGVPAVGAKLHDVQAARAVGARPILVRTGGGAETETQLNGLDVAVYDDLAAVAAVLSTPADAVNR